MITIVHGRGVGAGKSYYTCRQIITHLASGGTVYAAETFGLKWPETKAECERLHGVVIEDGQYRTFPEEDIPRLHEVTPPGTDDCPVLIVVDEAHGELNARDWGDQRKKAFFKWLTQSRHDNCDVLFITQHMHNMDKQIARLATYIISLRNMAGFTFPGLGEWPFKQFVVNRYDADGKTFLKRDWLWHSQRIFACYTSKIMGGSHKRLDGVVTRRNLQKTKTKPKPMKIILIVVMLALVGGGLLLWKTKEKVADLKPPSMPTSAPASPSAPSQPGTMPGRATPAQMPAAYTISHEKFRGRVGLWELHTDVAQYYVGRMSVHGLVVSVAVDTVRIVRPDGGLHYVVADSPTSASGGSVVVPTGGAEGPKMQYSVLPGSK